MQLLGRDVEPADLVIIGSHCVGLDLLVGMLVRQGIRAKSLYVGSMGGVAAAVAASATSPAFTCSTPRRAATTATS